VGDIGSWFCGRNVRLVDCIGMVVVVLDGGHNEGGIPY
jgi:hypothetical protein